jgi:hypothetical protein
MVVPEAPLETVIETSVFVESPELCVFDLLLPPPQPESTRQTTKIEQRIAPILFMQLTSSSTKFLEYASVLQTSPNGGSGKRENSDTTNQFGLTSECHPVVLAPRVGILVGIGDADENFLRG